MGAWQLPSNGSRAGSGSKGHSEGQEVGGGARAGATHRANGELLLDQFLQLLLAQGVLVTLLARVLVEDGHEKADGLIQGTRHD